MTELPIVGKEYTYLSEPVRVTRVVPCKGGTVDDAHVEFETRFAERSSCQAGELSPWERRKS